MFHKILMKITFLCVPIEVLFFVRLPGGILGWVKKDCLLFIFPCFSLQVYTQILLYRCLTSVHVFIFWGAFLFFFKEFPRVPQNASRTWSPGHI